MASGMQCFGCGVQFGMFKREHSCKKCGCIFCSSCTSYSAVMPEKGSAKHKVCFKCFKLLTSPPDTEPQRKQNDLNKASEPRILDSYQPNQAVRNIPVAGQSTESSSRHPDPDEIIRQRLQQLKDNHKDSSKVTDDDIGKRFQDLSGRKPISMQKSNINARVPKKTEQEEISDLLNQVTDECKLDDAMDTSQATDSSKDDKESSKADDDADKTAEEVQALITKTMEQCKNEETSEKDIEGRLAKLKGLDPSVYRNTLPQDIDSDDEEALNARYLQQVLGEAFLDDKTKAMGHEFSGKKNPKNQQPNSKGGSKDIVDASPINKPGSIFSKDYEADSDDDELPWCCICNANAVLRCHGCDDDLYCKRCYREGHKDEDPEEHTVSSFRPKKKHL